MSREQTIQPKMIREGISPDAPFRRQPQKVTVRLEGDQQDVAPWLNRLASAAEYKGDDVQKNIVDGVSTFVIYPRAVND